MTPLRFDHPGTTPFRFYRPSADLQTFLARRLMFQVGWEAISWYRRAMLAGDEFERQAIRIEELP